MTEWSKHVHRFAKKHNMSYKQANVSKKCKEAYRKRKTSPRRKRMYSPEQFDKITMYKTWQGKTSHEKQDPSFLETQLDNVMDEIEEIEEIIKDTQEKTGDTESGQARIKRHKITLKKYEDFLDNLEHDMEWYEFFHKENTPEEMREQIREELLRGKNKKKEMREQIREELRRGKNKKISRMRYDDL